MSEHTNAPDIPAQTPPAGSPELEISLQVSPADKPKRKRKPRTRANGTGTAVLRGKRWQARVVVGWKVSPDGTHKVPDWRTKDGFDSKKAALNHCAELLKQIQRPNKAPILHHYWLLYEEQQLPKLSSSKRTAYRIAYDRLSLLQTRRVDTLTVSDLRDAARDLTYYPARDVKVLLNHLFELAGADGWVSKDLPSYIELPKLQETEREPFTQEEQKALWKSYEAGDAWAAVPLIMIYTGMMPGELMKLTVEMLDLEHGRIHGVGLKTAVRRASDVYLPESIIPVLQAVTEGKTGKIWRVNKDRFYVLYYEALERAGVRKLSPYSCRHTTATALAIDKNVAPQTVKKIMRWSTTKMLDRYAHPDDEDAMTAVNSLTRLTGQEEDPQPSPENSPEHAPESTQPAPENSPENTQPAP